MTPRLLLHHAHSHAPFRHAVIPTPMRLEASEGYTGRGVTIAFLDSGFYPHPDLVAGRNRIVAYRDINRKGASKLDEVAEDIRWHGTQTSVSAAGNGHLSNGLYRGLACNANLALVKVSDERGRITEENIARGLEWVIRNRKRYGIRVVNISLGGDCDDASYRDNQVDQLAEEAMRKGIVVVVAAGNSGQTERHRPVPPANAPSVITVGGYDDGNRLGRENIDLYRSSFGPTADGIIKPEIIAPAMWVAAPILPGTSLYARAEALAHIVTAPDYLIAALADELHEQAELPPTIGKSEPSEIRSLAESILQREKIVAAHYQHVDGTSFAAPIVASVVAQMLEANPELTPAAVKRILIATATRLDNAPLVRQGYGMLNARAAVEAALRETHVGGDHPITPYVENDHHIFLYHNDEATLVSLAGDFNDWNPTHTICECDANGTWTARVPSLAPGRYRYKFVVDNERWLDDPSNGLKEPDEYGGWNSVVAVEEF